MHHATPVGRQNCASLKKKIELMGWGTRGPSAFLQINSRIYFFARLATVEPLLGGGAPTGKTRTPLPRALFEPPQKISVGFEFFSALFCLSTFYDRWFHHRFDSSQHQGPRGGRGYVAIVCLPSFGTPRL